MGLLDNQKRKKEIQELQRKTEALHTDISREIAELLEELNSEFEAHQKQEKEWEALLLDLANKLDAQERTRLEQLAYHLREIKQCARKGVDAMKQLARDHKKAAQENRHDYEEYLYL